MRPSLGPRPVRASPTEVMRVALGAAEATPLPEWTPADRTGACRDALCVRLVSPAAAGTLPPRRGRLGSRPQMGNIPGMSTNGEASARTAADNVLQALVLLSQRGKLRVVDVADELGIARSTAHRLLNSLLHRQFVVQDAQHVYHAGRFLRSSASARPGIPSWSRTFVHYWRKYTNVRAKQRISRCWKATGSAFSIVRTAGVSFGWGTRPGCCFLPTRTPPAGSCSPSWRPLICPPFICAGFPEQRAPPEKRARLCIANWWACAGAATPPTWTRASRASPALSVPLRDRGGRATAALAVAAPSVRSPRSVLTEYARILLEIAETAPTAFASV